MNYTIIATSRKKQLKSDEAPLSISHYFSGKIFFHLHLFYFSYFQMFFFSEKIRNS